MTRVEGQNEQLALTEAMDRRGAIPTGEFHEFPFDPSSVVEITVGATTFEVSAYEPTVEITDLTQPMSADQSFPLLSKGFKLGLSGTTDRVDLCLGLSGEPATDHFVVDINRRDGFTLSGSGVHRIDRDLANTVSAINNTLEADSRISRVGIVEMVFGEGKFVVDNSGTNPVKYKYL